MKRNQCSRLKKMTQREHEGFFFGTQTANAHIPNYTFPSIGNQDFILALYIKFN